MSISQPDSPTSTLRGGSPSSPVSWGSDSTFVNDPEPDEVDSHTLVSAIVACDVARVELLSRQHVQLCRADLWVLYDACLQGQRMMNAVLLNPDSTFNEILPGCDGDTVFHFVLRTPAARFAEKKRDVIKALLSSGANPLQCDRLGDTALHSLAGNIWRELGSGDTEGHALLKLLLCDSAFDEIRLACLQNIDAQNNYGNTPLVVATLYNHIDCVRLLLESGANKNVRGEDDKSALDFAVERGFHDIYRLLKASSRKTLGGIDEEP